LICSVWFVFDLIGVDAKSIDAVCEEVKDDTELSVKSCENSAVFSSLPLAIKWLRDSVQQNQSIRFQVVFFLVGGHYIFGNITYLGTHGQSGFICFCNCGMLFMLPAITCHQT
jgi:hypothetical protein